MIKLNRKQISEVTQPGKSLSNKSEKNEASREALIDFKLLTYT
jgi:hypothetical protein